MSKAQDDDLVISLVESALEQPRDKRESYLREACSGDVELLAEATDTCAIFPAHKHVMCGQVESKIERL